MKTLRVCLSALKVSLESSVTSHKERNRPGHQTALTLSASVQKQKRKHQAGRPTPLSLLPYFFSVSILRSSPSFRLYLKENLRLKIRSDFLHQHAFKIHLQPCEIMLIFTFQNCADLYMPIHIYACVHIYICIHIHMWHFFLGFSLYSCKVKYRRSLSNSGI